MPTILLNPLDSVVRHTIQHESGAELDVLTGRGGCLVGWRVPSVQGKLELLDGYASAADLQERYYSSHCGARLSPFPNRIKDGQWTWQGKTLQLDKNFPWENGHAIHGLLFDLPWSVKDFKATAEEGILTLACTYDGNHPGFPFAFYAESRYTLGAQLFTVETILRNTGSQEIPFGEGWHPYFRVQCPIGEAELQMTPFTMRLEVDDRSIPTGIMVPDDDFAKPTLIGERNLNTCWKFVGPGERAEVLLQNPSTKLCVRYWQERGPGGYEYIQLYTPPARQSLAIEPMTCPPDVLNNQLGLVTLAPGAEHLMRFGSRVEIPV